MKQHPLCTDTEQVTNVLDLAIPARVKQEWADLQTRRHFLGRAGKVLGWAAAASLLGDRKLRGDNYPAAGAPAGGCGASVTPTVAEADGEGRSRDWVARAASAGGLFPADRRYRGLVVDSSSAACARHGRSRGRYRRLESTRCASKSAPPHRHW